MTFNHTWIRKVKSLTLILFLLGSSFHAQCTRSTESEYIIEANRTPAPIRIDGFLDEPAWQNASPVILKENRSGREVMDIRVSTEVMTSYDDSTLYIAFKCNDPDIWTFFTQRDDHLWKEEAVEVFIDVDDIPETYVEIEVSPANILFDSYIVNPQEIDIPATAAFDLPRIETAVQVDGTLNRQDDTDKFWTVEIAVCLDDLVTERAKRVDTGTDVKINFYRLDKNEGREAAGYSWSPTYGRFHKPAAFGRLVFR